MVKKSCVYKAHHFYFHEFTNIVEIQSVPEDNYTSRNYDNKDRFQSYAFQASSVLKFDEINKVIEIGIGNKTLSNYLKQNGIEVTTCDYNYKLKPDLISDVRYLSVNDEFFDASLAFEILEHIPFSDFPKALLELSRVSRKYVIISIPISSIYLECRIKFKFPWGNSKSKYWKVQSPNFLSNKIGKLHKWELNTKGYSKKRIRTIIQKCNLEIIEEFEPYFNKYHHFFIMKKT